MFYLKPTKKQNQLVIAFCGPSTCGKSGIIKAIIEEYKFIQPDITVLLLDSFFYEICNLPKTNMRGKMIPNYDQKHSVNWDRFFRRIEKINTPVIILDGFILYADERTQDIIDVFVDLEYNLETDFEIALRRRIKRKAYRRDVDPPRDYLSDPFLDHLHYSCNYFHYIVWGEIVKHPEYRKHQKKLGPAITLKATDDLSSNIKKTLIFLRPFLESIKKQ